MQKLVTLTIDIESLQSGSGGSFSLSEIDALNDLLREGWVLESWEFVSAEAETKKPVIMAVLNDGMDGIGFEEGFYEPDEIEDFDSAEDDSVEKSGREGRDD